MNLDELRAQIDAIDTEILELLNKRAKIVLKVGEYKAQRGQELYVPSREAAIFERLAGRNTGPFPSEAIRKVWREIISASLSLEHPLRAVFLGPKASFTHIAAMQQFGHSAQLVPCKSIMAVFEEVERDRAQYGVIPIENSNEGAVTHTLDMFIDANLNIIAENYLPVHHDLLNRSGRMQDIKAIYSHPMALAQCSKWLQENCPDIPLYEVSSTAKAAQIVADNESSAAVASGAAANLYGLQVVSAKIEDFSNNHTRFLVVGKKIPKSCGKDKTSLLFGFQDGTGVLHQMLEPFSNRNINLMKIESRPLKNKLWNYVFYLDMEGHIEDSLIKDACDELQQMCTLFKVLGSYPRGR